MQKELTQEGENGFELVGMTAGTPALDPERWSPS